MTTATPRRLARALIAPAANLHLCGAILLAAVVAVIAAAALLPSKAIFVLAAAPTVIGVLLLVHAAASSDERRVDHVLARMTESVGLAIRPIGAPSVFSVLLYCAGVIGIVAGYGYLALAPSGIAPQDVIVVWGLLDKRPLVFAYLAIVALVVFHHAVVRLFFAPPFPGRAATLPRRSRIARLLGAVLVAGLAYGLFAAAALRDVVPDGNELSRFYEYHSLVHLGALEQIRLGAVPYLEAETQYGLGNQLLMFFLTKSLGFSNHGFYAGVLLVDVVCIIVFFVVVQQVLGLGWAIAGLAGWALWPSPDTVLPLAGWAILTRWLAVAILALLLARFLLAEPPRRGAWIAAVVTGAVWGIGGFMSQENLSGGLLVLVFSLALYGPASGAPLASLLRFAGLFMAGGVAAFVLLVASSIGGLHSLDVLREAGAQSGMVMAGLSNSVWSDNAGLTLSLEVVHGRLSNSLKTHGDLRSLLETYGFAVLLVLSIGLLARFLARSERERPFVWKFAGVAVGAYVLHLFTLLRSDLSHLAGPAFLLPLFLLMLPVFAWRCLRPGLGRGLLLLVSTGLIVDAVIASRAEIGRRLEAFAGARKDTAAALDVYATLRAATDQPLDPASRYSPIARYQAAFRATPFFAELQDLSSLLHDKLQGRRVELVVPISNDGMADPELLYFFGGFRSVSGITSPRGSLWLQSDEDAWIDRILKSPAACVFFDSRMLDSRLFRAWNNAAKAGGVVTQPIEGRRPYGLLSCKT